MHGFTAIYFFVLLWKSFKKLQKHKEL